MGGLSADKPEQRDGVPWWSMRFVPYTGGGARVGVAPARAADNCWATLLRVEWTPARIRLFRAEGLCLPQDAFAAELGFAKRTVGNAERGVHPPSLALRRALDKALEKASDAQRARFLASLTAEQTATQMTPASRDRGHRLAPTLDGVRRAVLGWPLTARMGMSENPAQEMAETTASAVATAMAAATQVHRLYQLADYDAAAQLLPVVLMRLQGQLGAHESNDESSVDTLTTAERAGLLQ
jgi:hypothetical protein